ncbi:MAG TPA: winged helix-turn-helix domain-containing protein [Rhodanobacteraceae bacterium]|nr:winged helix-turn-helix domain-containing protein [Rhodanobacteraceae bacterium]
MASETQAFGEFRFVRSARELWRGAKRVELPRRTFECLDYLIANRERAVGRDELVAAIFGRPDVSDAQLGQIVLRTRRAVGDDGNTQQAIRTIPGFGYRWVAEVSSDDEGDAPVERVPPSLRIDAASRAPVPAASPSSDLPPSDSRRTDPRRAGSPRAGEHRTDPRRAIPRRVAIALLVVAVAALAGAAALRHRGDAPSSANAIAANDSLVVLPIEVDGLREDGWVRLGAMDLVADRLREAGMRVPPSESVLTMLREAPDASGKTDARRVREIARASLAVHGKATRDASGWTVRLAAQPADGIEVPVEFADRDPVRAARGATDLLLAALGHTLPPEAERETAFDETLQRARAAMLANELDTARAILNASPELARAPAELDYRLALVDFREGRLDRADATLTHVLDEPAAKADPLFRARVLSARGATRIRRGTFADGGRDYEAALALLPTGRMPLERGTALVGRGNARVAAHRFDEALADFGASRVALESAGDALGVARVDANLGMLELYRGRPAEASGYLGGAADRFQSFGALHELLLTLTGIVDAQLSLLQRDDAWKTVERGWALRDRITDPDQRIDLALNRAQVLLGFGRYQEAEVLLNRVGAKLPSQNGVLTARARALIADLAARQQRWRHAADAAGKALADWPEAGADADRAPLVLIRQRALLALDEKEAAGALIDRTREVPDEPSSLPGSVADAIAMAEWSLAQDDTVRAAHWFRYAAASADRRGVPAEIVGVAVAYAPVLLDGGRAEEAATLIGRVASWSARDFDCALLQLRLFHALDQREPWFNALRQAQALAGEREIPQSLLTLPELGQGRVLRLTGT